jgi:hypothetical protein
MDHSSNQLNNNFSTEEENKTRPHKVQLLFGHYFIVLDPKLQPQEGDYVDQILEPNGQWTFRKRTIER